MVNITTFTQHEPCDPTVPRVLKSALKKSREKKSIRFDNVREFRFNRIQSFVTMPSYGGYSLGMDKTHYNGRELSLDKYRAEREQSRRRKMRRWRKRQQQVDVVTNSSSSEAGSDSEDEQAGPSDPPPLGMAPVTPERRKRLLERSGYHVTNDSIHDDQHIRNSRELCGCTCQGICYPESCSCYANGIGCQVDRTDRSFPCGCQPTQCWNPNGRTSFNAERVKSHFIRTMNRINSNESSTIPSGTASSTPPPPPSTPAQQNFSFGDFTLPVGDPPRQRSDYLHYWSYNWHGDHYHNIGMQSWSADNFYYDMISNQAPNTTPTNAAHSYSTSQHQSDMMIESPVDSSVTKKEESESSSESGIGDETSSSSPPAVTPFLCSSIETSITVAYQDDQPHTAAVPVGSE